jgi:peroxiredoxin
VRRFDRCRAVWVIPLVTALLGAAFAPATAEEKKKAPKAPDFTAKNLQGKSVTLSDLLKNGPVLLDFWTTYCKPCKLELPELDRLHRTYRDKGFQVVAIAQDCTKTCKKVKPYVRQRKYEMIVLLDTNKKVGNKYSVRAHPTSFLIDTDGSIVHFAQGYNKGDEKELEELVRGLLGLEAEENSSEEES